MIVLSRKRIRDPIGVILGICRNLVIDQRDTYQTNDSLVQFSECCQIFPTQAFRFLSNMGNNYVILLKYLRPARSVTDCISKLSKSMIC